MTIPRTKQHILAASLAAALLLSGGANEASAHAVAIGYTPGAAAGSVNLWLGSYHSDGVGDGNDIEGSASLASAAPYSSITPFAVSATSVPAGLIPGTNLFFASGYALPNILSWEAATVGGLSPDTYTFNYVPDASPTQHWAPRADLVGIQLTLTAGDTAGGGTDAGGAIPEPATAGLLAFGLAGLAAGRRRGARR